MARLESLRLREQANRSSEYIVTFEHPRLIAARDSVDWQHYRAELASKIAVAYAEKGRYKPSEIGEFAVMVANDVVDNLKRRSE